MSSMIPIEIVCFVLGALGGMVLISTVQALITHEHLWTVHAWLVKRSRCDETGRELNRYELIPLRGWFYAKYNGKKISPWYLIGEIYWALVWISMVYLMMIGEWWEMAMYFFGILILVWWLIEADIRRYEVSWSMVWAAILWILFWYWWWTYESFETIWSIIWNYTVVWILVVSGFFTGLWAVGKIIRRNWLWGWDSLVWGLIGAQTLWLAARIGSVFPNILVHTSMQLLYRIQIFSLYCIVVALCGLIYALIIRKNRIPFLPVLLLWYGLLYRGVDYRVPVLLQ
jgi:hypothetical protein